LTPFLTTAKEKNVHPSKEIRINTATCIFFLRFLIVRSFAHSLRGAIQLQMYALFAIREHMMHTASAVNCNHSMPRSVANSFTADAAAAAAMATADADYFTATV
jgi:hypothetical protein